MAEELLRVKSIHVYKLFGRYTHAVSLRTEDRVTIIHGPNGIGKTVLLKLVSAALSGTPSTLMQVPFESLHIGLSDGTRLQFNQRPSDKSVDDVELNQVVCSLDGAEPRVAPFVFSANQTQLRRTLTRLTREVPWLTAYGDKVMDRRSGEVMSIPDAAARFAAHLPRAALGLSAASEPEWFAELKNKIRVHFIETQRLLRPRPSSREWSDDSGPEAFSATITSYAKNLRSQMSDALAAYAKQSQALDESFPRRLLSRARTPLPVTELKARMEALEQKRARLKQDGFISEESAYPFDVTQLDQVSEYDRAVMSLYVVDTERKLGTLDSLARRVQLLLSIVNRKFTHKSITIHRERGLAATTVDGQDLKLDSLSSGEQHELVMLYSLLFRVQPNSLVLIDEPELSLHVTWQKAFLPDLLEIVAANEFDVVLATHSPFIAGERTDLLVSLTGDG